MRILFAALVIVAAACAGDDVAPAEPTVATASPSPSTGPATVSTGPTTSSTEPLATSRAPTTVPPTSVPASSTTSTQQPDPDVTLALEVVASGFSQPVFLTAPDDDLRLFVVEQPGVIWVLDGQEAQVFLDIRSQVGFGGERGLLGLAFHPAYADNGLFYVNFTDGDGATRIVEFGVSADPAVADPDSARLLLEIAQPAGNHNGGMVAFGPDGHLWIGMGDGGGANDRFGHGQRSDTLLGSMLRIDVTPGGGAPYMIPADNPFADGGGAPEVRAIGVRNPWRFAFDGNRLLIADVGQDEIEEISVVDIDDPRINFGWPVREGNACFDRDPCDVAGLIPAAVTYDHSQGCSITGGYVYRGAAIPEITGHYFYGDYCSGFVRSVLFGASPVVDPVGGPAILGERVWLPASSASSLTWFGVDAAGELYVLTGDGTVSRIVADG
ncbi:MAG: PQQ-dependent sugar dehydrogenase [Acidimicrobiia bacterium]